MCNLRSRGHNQLCVRLHHTPLIMVSPVGAISVKTLMLLTEIRLFQKSRSYIHVWIWKEQFLRAVSVTVLIYRQVSACTACKSWRILNSAATFLNMVISVFSEPSSSVLQLVQFLLWRRSSLTTQLNVHQIDIVFDGQFQACLLNFFKHTVKVFYHFWFGVGSYTNVVTLLRASIRFHYMVQVFHNYASKNWQRIFQPCAKHW